MEDSGSGRKRQIITTLAVLIVVVIIVAAAAMANKKEDTTSTANSGASSQPSETTTSDTTSSGASSTGTSSSADTYKDGTYKASGSYNTPGGTESISVSVTLKDGVVTDSTVTGDARDPEAEEYQGQFIDGYKQYVTGKKIDSINLSRVAGSSLTPQGFNDAIDAIESQAQA